MTLFSRLVHRFGGIGLACLALLASPAHAEDYRGSVGVGLAAGAELADVLTLRETRDQTAPYLELQPQIALGDNGNLLVLRLRMLWATPGLGIGDSRLGPALGVSYRFVHNTDAFKTFVNLGLKLDSSPNYDVGPLVDFGAIYDFTPLFGLFADLGASFEAGHGLRGGVEGQLGLVARSYLLQ